MGADLPFLIAGRALEGLDRLAAALDRRGVCLAGDFDFATARFGGEVDLATGTVVASVAGAWAHNEPDKKHTTTNDNINLRTCMMLFLKPAASKCNIFLKSLLLLE